MKQCRDDRALKIIVIYLTANQLLQNTSRLPTNLNMVTSLHSGSSLGWVDWMFSSESWTGAEYSENGKTPTGCFSPILRISNNLRRASVPAYSAEFESELGGPRCDP